MNAPVIQFMAGSAPGSTPVGPIFSTNSMKFLIHGGSGYLGEDYKGPKALELLRPCLDSPNGGLRINATLQHEEWQDFDRMVKQATLETLVGVPDLLSRGLRRNLGNPFGTITSIWQSVSEMTAADVSMRAGTPPTNDRLEFDTQGVPIPIVSKGFWLDERTLAASRTIGDGLDTTQATAATRVVSEGLENLLFNGSFSGGTAYTLQGYTTKTGRNTGSLAASWTTATPKQIVDDVREMVTDLHDDNVGGPYVLYIPYGWDPYLSQDYVVGTFSAGYTTVNRTVRERIMQENVEAIRPTRQLTDECVLVAMRSDIVDVIYGFEPRLVQWEEQGGMVNNFRVMAIMSFRIKNDYHGRSGIAHHSV